VVLQSTERAAPARGQRATQVEPYVFLLVEGARPDAGGMRIALAGLDALQIGRGEARMLRSLHRATQVLDVPDAQMSSNHARIVARDGKLVLEDAGSTNGTRVDGEAVAAHVLRDGDIFELGQTCLMYRELEEPAGTRACSLDASALTSLEPGFATFDPSLARSLERLARLAASPLSILLLGETGSGKEVLARGLHALSQRPGRFVAVNCGAIPQNLVESQLFGHVRGAFSGAVKDEPGLVRAANGGTLLLDEIGDLPSGSQAALLRVLQEGEVLPVGSTTAAQVDVRVIAATHRPLEDLIARDLFRRDLYARLAGYTFTLAPLRDRLVDLGLLVAALLAAGKLGARRGVRIQPDAVRAMLHHDWPMNVRELEQCLGAACVLAENGVITAGDLPPSVASAPEHAQPEPEPVDQRAAIVALLARHEGNLSAVARALRTSRSQLYRLMERYGIGDKP
jgi:transcriptional regulator with PAS, ATPase and Fis domain